MPRHSFIFPSDTAALSAGGASGISKVRKPENPEERTASAISPKSMADSVTAFRFSPEMSMENAAAPNLRITADGANHQGRAPAG